MSKYNVNFRDITKAVLWFYLRTTRFLAALFSYIKPLQTLHNDGVIVEAIGQKDVSFSQLVSYLRNLINFDARTLYIQKYLNDIYDPVQQRIVIVNDNASHVLYLFNKAEQSDPVYFYNEWDSTVAYIEGSNPGGGTPLDEVDADFVFNPTDNHIYHAILTAGNTNKRPDLNPLLWKDDGVITYMFNFDDQFPVDYRIDMPLSIISQLNYSNARMKSQIDLLNSAGRTYSVVELGTPTNVFFTNLQ